MFAQGNVCFFCAKPLPKNEASVEHLVALANGGGNGDDNCVACCKSLNSLFGRVSLKEKLKIILNQRGAFSCPGATTSKTKTSTPSIEVAASPVLIDLERISRVVKDLQKRGNARPRTVEKLLNTIKTHFVQIGDSAANANTILKHLQAKRYVALNGLSVTYALPPKDA
ncbi:MAG: HNH endonuclease [Betaproteobacteria bacterium]